MNSITSSRVRSLLASAIFCALAPGFAGVSGAAEIPTPPHSIVKYGDLDLSSPQGAAALYSRIQKAAGSVCWRMYDSDFAYRANKDACLQGAIADAVSKVNRPELSAVYEANHTVTQPVVLTAARNR
jgi:UrcA family protein